MAKYVDQEFFNTEYKQGYEVLTDEDKVKYDYIELKMYNLVDNFVGGLINELGPDQLLIESTDADGYTKKEAGWYVKMAIASGTNFILIWVCLPKRKSGEFSSIIVIIFSAYSAFVKAKNTTVAKRIFFIIQL